MAVFELLVQAAELAQAANEMNQAAEIYREAVETCKTTAADLASKWEGDAKEKFVAQQENAYSWHQQILQVVRQMAEVINKAIEMYSEMEDAAKKIVGQLG